MTKNEMKQLESVRLELSGKIDNLCRDVFGAIHSLRTDFQAFKENELAERVTKADCLIKHKTITSSNLIYAFLIFALGSAITAIFFLASGR